MRARDDYPFIAKWAGAEAERALDEIDGLRAEVEKWRDRFWRENKMLFDAVLEIKRLRASGEVTQ